MKLLTALAVLAGTALLPDEETKFVPLDYSKLEREIAVEPAYVAAPRYALFVFGPRGDARMWAVLDKSAADAEHYDVLYFDVDADGDLTEEGERFQGTWNEKAAKAGVGMSIWIDELPVPGTDLVHEKLRVSTVGKKKDSPGIWTQMQWNGEVELSGGYAKASPHVTNWADSPAQAPILRPTPLGPFSFGLYTWGADEVKLAHGKSDKVYVLVGQAGSGPDTMMVVDEEFLDLEQDALYVTLIGEDADGTEVRGKQVRLKEHC